MERVRVETIARSYTIQRKYHHDIHINCTIGVKPLQKYWHIGEAIKNALDSLGIVYSIEGYCGKWDGKQYDTAIVRINEKDCAKVETKLKLI